MPKPTQPQQLLPYWKQLFFFLKDRHTDWKPKALLLIAVLYLIWPVDFAPDLIPFLGWLDDLGLGALAAWYVMRTARTYKPSDE